MIVDMFSVGEPCGEGLEDSPDWGLLRDPPEEGELDKICSDNAVVAMALAVAAEPAKGIRAEENFDDVDCRDAREPGRKVPEILGTGILLS